LPVNHCADLHARIAFVQVAMTMPVMEPDLDAGALRDWAPAVDDGPFSSLCWGERMEALADPVRVKIVSYLFSSAEGDEISGELASILGLAESTVSHHLTQLRKAGLVVSQRRGMNVFHQVRRDALQALCIALGPYCCS
jgi:ArsR family transcriptional regulator, arsenate/arsenite/antimonite-responsive transcriptional repressor